MAKFVLGCLLSLMLAAVAPHSTATADEPPMLRIGTAWPRAAVYAKLWVAKDLGYYEANGVKVEITEYRGGAAAQQALVAGEADIINFFPPGAILAVAKGVEQKVIGADVNSPIGWALITKADSGIESIEDLAGRRVGVTGKGATTAVLAAAVLDRYGVDAELIALGGNTLPALLSGDVDATSHAPSSIARAREKTDIRILVDYEKELPNSLPSIWIATDAAIESNPEAVAGFLRATYQAVQYMKANEVFSIDFLTNYMKLSDPESIRIAHEYDVMNQETRAALERAWLEGAIEMARLVGLEGDLSVEDFYTDRFSGVGAD